MIFTWLTQDPYTSDHHGTCFLDGVGVFRTVENCWVISTNSHLVAILNNQQPVSLIWWCFSCAQQLFMVYLCRLWGGVVYCPVLGKEWHQSPLCWHKFLIQTAGQMMGSKTLGSFYYFSLSHDSLHSSVHLNVTLFLVNTARGSATAANFPMKCR